MGRADAHGGAAHRGDQRLGRGRDRPQELPHRLLLRLRRVLRVRRARQEVLQIVTGRKAIGLAVNQHHAHPGVCVGRTQCIGHRLVHRNGQRVLLVEPIELDAGDAVAGLGKNVA
jgi:hypothetical protein